MFIPDPDFYPSWIPYPTTATKEEGKFLFVLPFFLAANIPKLKIISFLNRKRKI
jgi:hypothetical protein